MICMKSEDISNRKRKEIEELILEKHFLEFSKRNILYGKQNFNKAKDISTSGAIETMKPADGIYSAKKIGDAFCNCEFADEYGIDVDTYKAGSTPIPIIRIDNIYMTIKSIKNVDNIIKKPPTYMKELVKNNINLEGQINMFDKIDEKLESKFNDEKYYGILTYHFNISDELEHITVVFYDSKLENELLRVEAPKDMLNTREPIAPTNKPTVSEENLNKGNESLKKILTLKKI